MLPARLAVVAASFVMLVNLPIASDLSVVLPDLARGWKAAGPDGVYDASSLHLHIDGASEVYLALNFRAARTRRYVREGFPEILADLFDMGSSRDAYGAYHHDVREGAGVDVGQESEYVAGALAFWKGRCFVSIMALQETTESRLAVLELGRKIAAAIEPGGAPPDLARLLPERRLIPARVHYFHSQDSLDRYVSMPGANLLRLDPRTEGLIARCRAMPAGGGAPPYTLLLVSYPSSADAEAALARLREEIFAGADSGGVARLREGLWAGTRAAGDLLIVVLEAPSRADVEETLEEVRRRRMTGAGS